MKKLPVLIALVMLGMVCRAESLFELTLRNDDGIWDKNWTAFQLNLVPAKYGQLFTSRTNVYGIALAVTCMQQKSGVLTVGLTSGLEKNYGIQCCATCMTGKNYGLSVAPLGAFVDRNYGVQIGVANLEEDLGSRKGQEREGWPGIQIGFLNVGGGIQIGVINYNPDSKICKFFPIINF